jgi:hypothetical protein
MIVIAVVLALVIVGAIAVPILAKRRHKKLLQDQFKSEYDLAVETLGDEKKAERELDERRKHVEALKIQPLSSSQREHYIADWAGVQSKFVDEPEQALADADRLIMEVMQLRAYPIADFEQRAADLSVNYPDLVSDYRAARSIANKNAQHQASTEELRHAMIYYRSLFDELLEKKEMMVEEISR